MMVVGARVLVVGGGIAGLSVAIALHKTGHAVSVYEQASALREVGAGVGIWSNAMASLDLLGAGAAIRRCCRPQRTVAAADPLGRTLMSYRVEELGPEFSSASCYVVPRSVLLDALAEQLPPACIHTGARANSIESFDSGVRVTFEDGSAAQGDLLVGADGLHSVVRKSVVGADALRYSGQTCFRGIAKVPSREPGVVREIQGRAQRGSVCQIDDETVYWWVAHNAAPNAPISVAERRATLLERYRGWPFGLPEAIAATGAHDILQNDLVDRAPTRTYVRGRLVLTGDAAHPTTPNLGQGANMAIDDAVVLARALRELAGVEPALERYQHERLPRTREIVKRSWRFGRAFTWHNASFVALREFALRNTPTSVMRKMMRQQILESAGSL